MQLDLRSLEEARAVESLKRSRLGNKKYFDSKKRMRGLHQRIQEGDLVLLHNTRIQKSWDKKVDNNWFGPYRVREGSEIGFYRLNELDGTELKESVTGNRVKKFFSRGDHLGSEMDQMERNVEGPEGEVGIDPTDPDGILVDSSLESTER